MQKPFVICVMLCVLGYLFIAWLGGGWSRLWSAPSEDCATCMTLPVLSVRLSGSMRL